MADTSDDIQEELAAVRARLEKWAAQVRSSAEDRAPVEARRRRAKADAVEASVRSLIANRTPAPTPHVRVVAVIVPARASV